MSEPTTKRGTAKKATARKPAARKPKPEKAIEHPVGTTVELEVEDDATEVLVERPDNTSVTVFAAGGRALYVLDRPGVHVAGGLAINATEPEDS